MLRYRFCVPQGRGSADPELELSQIGETAREKQHREEY